MTKEQFVQDIKSAAEQRPSHIRYGQAVFNYIDDKYKIARIVQYVDKIDCFYNDNKVDEFIEACWKQWSSCLINDKNINYMNNQELFKDIKPIPWPTKGKNGFLGYGCFPSQRSIYSQVDKRKRNRYIRKYGFDITESWSLDYTITRWLSDNIGGYFRECGYMDCWFEVDLEGNSWDPKSNPDPFIEAERARKEDYLRHLNNFIKESDKITIQKFIDFVVPRLDYLAKNTHGYPDNFKTFSEWQELLSKMVHDLQINHYSEEFIKYFFSLWD